MLSKRSRLVPLLVSFLAIGFALPACSLRVGEELERPVVTVNPAKEGCLANMGDVLDRYFDGRIEEAELESFWVCTEKALNTFVLNTKGGGGDHYTPAELSSFLTRYFMKGKEISPALLAETMELKTALVGGANNLLTRAELEQAMAILRTVHVQSQRLRPFMPITASSFRARNFNSEQFEQALGVFNESMFAISQALVNVQGAYTVDHLADFLRALKNFLYEGKPAAARENWADVAIRWTDALRPAKAIFVAPPRDEIRASDWAKIYELAPRYYGLFLKASFYLEAGETYTHGPGLQRLETLFTDFHSLMSLVLSHREDGAIASAEIDDLLSSLNRNKMLPERLPLEAARSFARAIFGRIFSGTSPVAGEESYTITKANFDRLQEGFLFATEGLRGLEAFYRDRLGDKFETANLPRDEVANLPVDTMLRFTAAKGETSRAAVESLRASARDVRTVFPGNALKVLIPEGAVPTELSLAHLEKIHLLRSANRLVLHGYAGNRGEYLSEAQVGLLADDIFPFLRGLGFGDANLRKSLGPRLLEASLFLYSSDGELGLTMNEALEFESLLVSTLVQASDVHKKIASTCLADAKAIPADCYRAAFLGNQKKIWANIPGVSAYVDTLSKEEQNKLFLLMDSFLRKEKYRTASAPPFGPSDTQAFILMPYYVEMLFSRFDRDGNGYFDNAEAEAAYPVFQPFLKEKCIEHELYKPEDHKAVYNFLLAYQELPTNMKLTYAWRRFIMGDKKFRVNRGQVVQIFQRLLSL